jgi:predicted Zn-dependent protease
MGAMRNGSLCAFVAMFMACSTPEVRPPSPIEVARKDNALGQKLLERWEFPLRLHRDLDLEVYLRTTAAKLQQASPMIREFPLAVSIVHEEASLEKNYAFPGIQLYLSQAQLKRIEFENELAALIAVELARVEQRQFLRKMERDSPEDPSLIRRADWRDLFDFEEAEDLEATAGAVQLLYRAGYDVRGVATFWEKLIPIAESTGHSRTRIELLREHAYKNIALLPPLRNPIVRTEAFDRFRKRVQQR